MASTSIMVYLWASLLLFHATGLMGQNNFNDDIDDDNDKSCLPKLADSCFSDIYHNLECHLNPRAPYECQRRDINDLCSSIEDGLSCASDIIDTDCTQQQGRDRFDSWIRGLRAVYYSLCSENSELLKVLVQNAQCWNSLEFVTCVERDIQVTHVVDLLKQNLDLQMCNHLLIAMATCNVQATNPIQACQPPQVVVREVLQTFFSQSACGAACFRMQSSVASAAGLIPHWFMALTATCSALM